MNHPGPGPAGHVPQPPKDGLRVGEGQPTQAAGFINVQGRLYAPLQGLNPADVTQGGYRWLSPTDFDAYGNPHTLHPGVDLNSGGSCNADEGLPVVAMLGGVVRAVILWDGTSSGEGTHLWYEVTDACSPGPTFIHYDHLKTVSVVQGQRVTPGQVLAAAGRSGGWDCSHLHCEWSKGPPPNGWFQWPYGWTREQVEEAYYNPRWWWDAAAAKVGAAPPEVVQLILSGAQSAVVQAAVWGQYWRPEADTFAIEASWREEWRRGVWRGAPLSDEQLLPEDAAENKPGGAFRLFEGGVACWLPGQEVSWNG